jgi:hypothetical protein
MVPVLTNPNAAFDPAAQLPFEGRCDDHLNPPAATAGARCKENIATHSRQPGDPVRAAQAIIDAIETSTPPFRLILGRSAAQRIRAELEAQLREIDGWMETSNNADCPET